MTCSTDDHPSPPVTTRRARRRAAIARVWRWSIAAWILYAVILVGIAGWRARDPQHRGSDFAAFYLTAQKLSVEGRINPGYRTFYYLPFFVVLCEPVALFPCWLSCAAFTATSLALFGWAVWFSFRALLPNTGEGAGLLVGVPALLVVPFVTACAVQGQVTLLIVFLLQAAWWLFAARRRSLLAGLPLAVAVLIKPFLVCVVAFFMWKRAWRTALATLACMVLLGGAWPLLRVGPTEWLRSHEAYWQRAARGYSPLVAAVKRPDPEARFRNQSLPVVLKRLLTRTDAKAGEATPFVNVADLPPRHVAVLYVALAAAWFVGVGWLTRRPFGSTMTARWHFEYALAVVSGLVLSPIVWAHYFPLLVYPLMLLTAQLFADANSRRRDVLVIVVWGAWAAAALSLLSELFAPAYLRAIGIHMWAALAVGVALASCATRVGAPAASGEPREATQRTTN